MLDDEQKKTLVADLLEFVHLTVEQARDGRAGEGQVQAMATIATSLAYWAGRGSAPDLD